MTDQPTGEPTERERALLHLLAAAVRREQADGERARVFSLGPLMSRAEQDRAREASHVATAELTAAFRAIPDDLHTACLDAVYGPQAAVSVELAGTGAPS